MPDKYFFTSDSCDFDSFAVASPMCTTNLRAAIVHDFPCMRIIFSRKSSAVCWACPDDHLCHGNSAEFHHN